MCKIGDIILVNKYKDNGKTLKRHSFVVINDDLMI
jgi:co-chaperonin GroES (HSP10)